MSNIHSLHNKIMYFVVFSSKTAFFRLVDIFPECGLYQEKSPQLEPMVCLTENVCHVGHSCMDKLARRVHAIFEEVVPSADLLLLYYRKRNYDGLGASIFYRDMSNPRNITMNPYAWERIKRRGKIFEFDPSVDFFLTGGDSHIGESDISSEL